MTDPTTDQQRDLLAKLHGVRSEIDPKKVYRRGRARITGEQLCDVVEACVQLIHSFGADNAYVQFKIKELLRALDGLDGAEHDCR